MNKKFILILSVIIGLVGFTQNLAVRFTYAEEIRDPFVSLGDKIESAQKLEGVLHLPYPIVLKGTLYSKNKLVAIINNNIIQEGQKWQDFYVEKIERGKVILEWRGKKFEIFLSPKEEKQKEKK